MFHDDERIEVMRKRLSAKKREQLGRMLKSIERAEAIVEKLMRGLDAFEAENWRKDWFDGATGRDCTSARLAAAQL